MRAIKHSAIATALLLAAVTAQAGTLEDVQARGELNCVVTTGLAGFAAPNENGRWDGFDVTFCRAVAAAVLGDGEKVKFVPSTGKTRFTLLNSGEGDIMFRNTTETMSRDADLKLTFLPVNYYDGQGFLIRKDLGITSAAQLDGASVCIQTGTTTELNLADYFNSNGMSYEPVNTETNEESIANYTASRCDAYTTDASALASTRAALDDPSAHMILRRSFPRNPWRVSCATAMTTGPTLQNGWSMQSSSQKSSASPGTTSMTCVQPREQSKHQPAVRDRKHHGRHGRPRCTMGGARDFSGRKLC